MTESCASGNCPTCKVVVGAIPVVGRSRHLFILYSEGDRHIVYRGGPEKNSKYAEAAAAGRAQEYKAAEAREWDLGSGFGLLVTHRMVGLARNPDYVAMTDQKTIAEGPEFCGLDPVLTMWTRRVGMAGRVYDLPNALGTDNSNATIRTILRRAGLPEEKPDVWAPGWGSYVPL